MPMRSIETAALRFLVRSHRIMLEAMTAPESAVSDGLKERAKDALRYEKTMRIEDEL